MSWFEYMETGTFVFWTMVFVTGLCFLGLLENNRIEQFLVSFVVLLVIFALVLHYGYLSVTYLLPSSMMALALMIGGYLICGSIWGVVKWWFFVHHARRKLDECVENLRDSFPEKYKDHAINSPVYINEFYSRGLSPEAPRVSKNKSKIMTWMILWPWSLLWTMLNDPIRRFFSWVIRILSAQLQAMSDNAFKDIKK